MRFFFGILSLLAVIYVGICIGYRFLHPYFVFIPWRRLNRRPGGDYSFRELFFESFNNVTLQAWLLRPSVASEADETKRPVILFCPGNIGTIAKYLSAAEILVDGGYDVFLFGYRGFGHSDFRWPTEKGVYHDTQAAFVYLRDTLDYPPDSIVILGQSIGCAPASFAASKYNPRALVIEGGFPSFTDVVRRVLPWLPVRMLTTARFDLKGHLQGVTCPVLVFHSREDKAIPPGDADTIFENICSYKEKVIIDGIHARGIVTQPDIYIERLNRFLRRIS